MTGPMEPLGILAAARRIEIYGIDFYQRFSECVVEENGSALLRGLARDEAKHKEVIEKEMHRLSPGIDPSTVAIEKGFLNIIPEKAFPFPKDACLSLEDAIKALELGIQVEVNSIRMYSEAVSRIKEAGTKEVLQELVGIEEEHRKLLEENLALLRLDGAWYGYNPILEG